MQKQKIEELDSLIADRVKDFEAELLQADFKQRRLAESERQAFLNRTLGNKVNPLTDEAFTLGDAEAGITSRSIWFGSRRVHYAVLVSIAIGEIEGKYSIDLNCTLNRSFRVIVDSISETDTFLCALSGYTSFKIVPTVEEVARVRREEENREAMRIQDEIERQRRLEYLARQQNALLQDLVVIESSPRTSFGVIF